MSFEYTLKILVINGILKAKKASLMSMMGFPSCLMLFAIPHGNAMSLASSSLAILSSRS